MKKTCSVFLSDRNDEYKDINRAKYTLNCFLECFDEIWLIDWATDKGKKPLLHELYDFYPHLGKIRHIIITPEMADYLTKDMGLETKVPNVIAKNILIRRIETDFMVSSGLDIFGPSKADYDEMFPMLRNDVFYTVSRRELPPENLFNHFKDTEWKQALEYFRINSDERRFFGGASSLDVQMGWSIINCCGDFQMAHKDIWKGIKGFEEKMIHRCFDDTNVQKKAKLAGHLIVPLFSPPVFHISHPMILSAKFKNNDVNHWVDGFSKSENTDNWGFADVNFDIEVI